MVLVNVTTVRVPVTDIAVAVVALMALVIAVRRRWGRSDALEGLEHRVDELEKRAERQAHAPPSRTGPPIAIT